MTADIKKFIEKWKSSGGSEIANSQLFLSELCDILGVPRPDPAKPQIDENKYVFERTVKIKNPDDSTSTKRIDLYKRGCFVLESKQGTERREKEASLSKAFAEKQKTAKKGTATRGTVAWDDAMQRARGQADQYIRALPASEGRPPFLLVVDVGYAIEMFSEFTCTGGTYIPYPDPRNYRLYLPDLENEEHQETLRKIWIDPHSLDPSKRTATVTRDIAERLAKLAKSLEGEHDAEVVAAFLMRCLFTMFAEDMQMLPKDSFTDLLQGIRGSPERFVPMVEELWSKMNTGGFSTALRNDILHFDGGLFEDSKALPVTDDQLELLIEAAKADWCDVEPAIFGSLLERALSPTERHKLGAHFTPRSYVERLVVPTIVEPLRSEWSAVQAAVVSFETKGRRKEAISEVKDFHKRLCETRILDPACGSGNFLYVSMEHMKRLEGEVLNTLQSLAGQSRLDMSGLGYSVDPHQFLGIEINPRAVAITELVLWIGYLQWHYRTRGDVTPPEPVIKKFQNIECRDALLDWDSEEPLLDEAGKPVTRWNGRTTKTHPVTQKEVPDETAREPVVRYVNPGIAEWPEADFVVGNPPFIGAGHMREVLGDGYTETVRKVHSDCPESCDYVVYWWNHAAQLVKEGSIRRFGFIATNSLRQTFNRRVLQSHMAGKKPLSITFAIPDHPWIDSADGAAVRISMTVGEAGEQPGRLMRVSHETKTDELGMEVSLDGRIGTILPDLTIGADVSSAVSLKANEDISCPGVKLHGSGFIVTPEQAKKLGLGRVTGLEKHIRLYRNGRDITQTPRGVMVIDLYGLSEEDAMERFPEVYQWVLEHVRPQRKAKGGTTKDSIEYSDNWWLFGKVRKTLRRSLEGLSRYIATVETSKHCFFVFLEKSILPDNMLVNIALYDAFFLGVLSSRVHVTWALRQGGTLEDRPRYNKTRCFDTFPFPTTTEERRRSIRKLAEALDAHRKRQQKLYPKLTITNVYNVLQKLRGGEVLSKKEQQINEQGLVDVLRQYHDDLDVEVAAAYGWPSGLSDEEILDRLTDLNKERFEEERNGVIRWLRPDFQNPRGTADTQLHAATVTVAAVDAKPKKLSKKTPWPKTRAEQAKAVRDALFSLSAPATTAEIAKCFSRAQKARITELLEAFASLGQVRQLDDGRYIAE